MSVPVLHEDEVEELDLPGRRFRWLVADELPNPKHCSVCVIRVPRAKRCVPRTSIRTAKK